MKNGAHIQLRSTAVQAILKKVPRWIVRWGTILVFLGVLLLFVLAYMIRIPESVGIEVGFEIDRKPFCITAAHNGLLLVEEVEKGTMVKEGELLFECNSGSGSLAVSEQNINRVFAPFDGEVGWVNRIDYVEIGDTILKIWHQQPEFILMDFQLSKKYYNIICNKEFLLVECTDPFSAESVIVKMRIKSLSVVPGADSFGVFGFIPIDSQKIKQFSKYSWIDSKASVVIGNPRLLFKLFALFD